MRTTTIIDILDAVAVIATVSVAWVMKMMMVMTKMKMCLTYHFPSGCPNLPQFFIIVLLYLIYFFLFL